MQDSGLRASLIEGFRPRQQLSMFRREPRLLDGGTKK